MKKLSLLCITLILCPLLLFSCREDRMSSEPSVKLERLDEGITSLKFSITTENAADAAYWVYVADDTYVPGGGDIFSKGVRIGTGGADWYEVSDLDPNTAYTVAAVAKNSMGIFSDISSVNMSTRISSNLYSFDVTLPEVGSDSVVVAVVPSSDEACYVIDLVEAGTYADMTPEEIHAEYLRIFEGLASNEGLQLEDILAVNLVKGRFEGTIKNLAPLTSYEVIVFGMDPEAGFVTSDVYTVPFETHEHVLTIDVRVENVTALSADVYVIPSNNDNSFVWLCEPRSKYPDMSLEEIADAYNENFGYLLDQGMGLYQGPQEYSGYELMPGMDYYILAYGYEPGEGVSTAEVAGQFFSSLPGGSIDDFDAAIEITEVQGQRIDYTVTPSDMTVYYLPGCMKTAEYSDSFVREDVESVIADYCNANQELNPSYTIEEAVNALCFLGEQTLYASPLESNTEYTVFTVPVDVHGNAGSRIVSAETMTKDLNYSDAVVTSEYIGAWDAAVLQEAGYFEDEYLNGYYIMAFRINASPTCDTLKIKAWNGYTELTDQELIDIIEPYWDQIYTGDDLDRLRYVYTTTPSYYAGAMTFCTLGLNSDGVRAEMGRNYVDLFYEDALLPLEDWLELQDSPSSVPRKVIVPNGKMSEVREVPVIYCCKSVE